MAHLRTISVFVFLCAGLYLVECALNPEEGVCSSDADCGEEECCVALDRRRRFLFSHSSTGICRTMRYQGYACHVFFTTDPQTHLHVNYCPCADGLECRGTSIDSHNSSHVIHHDPKCLPKQN